MREKRRERGKKEKEKKEKKNERKIEGGKKREGKHARVRATIGSWKGLGV